MHTYKQNKHIAVCDIRIQSDPLYHALEKATQTIYKNRPDAIATWLTVCCQVSYLASKELHSQIYIDALAKHCIEFFDRCDKSYSQRYIDTYTDFRTIWIATMYQPSTHIGHLLRIKKTERILEYTTPLDVWQQWYENMDDFYMFLLYHMQSSSTNHAPSLACKMIGYIMLSIQNVRCSFPISAPMIIDIAVHTFHDQKLFPHTRKHIHIYWEDIVAKTQIPALYWHAAISSLASDQVYKCIDDIIQSN